MLKILFQKEKYKEAVTNAEPEWILRARRPASHWCHCGEVTHPRTQAEAAELSPPSAHPCPQPPSEPRQASRGQVGFYKWVGVMTHPGPLRESPSDLSGSRGFHSSQSTPLAAQRRKESWGGVHYLVALRGQHPIVLGHEHLQGGDVVVAQVHLHRHEAASAPPSSGLRARPTLMCAEETAREGRSPGLWERRPGWARLLLPLGPQLSPAKQGKALGSLSQS